jgi:methylmalonyl-CoA/ethylmalonyl-CoA epimerase
MTSNDFGLHFHHLGLATKNTSLAQEFLKGLGYRSDIQVYDPLQKVNLVMCWHDRMPAVEIIFPSKEKGPLDGLLSKRPEGIVYHMCYESDDILNSLAEMEAAGLRVMEIAPPTPAILFGNREVSFYMVTGVGLIEIIRR